MLFKKKVPILTVVVTLFMTLLFQTVGFSRSLFEETFNGEGTNNPGTIHIGTLPAKPDPNKPVLVFVQGLTNNSTIWYEGNNMYSLAQQQGFETAFVELYDSAGTPKSYWDNGAILAEQLEQISEYFGGKKLVIIGYSKGGVDAQVALIHEGKHHLVSDVVTIASPHWGSELADLANSSSLGWLAALIGQDNEGTQSLQTGVMNHFRAMTDSKWQVQQNRYYSIAGNRAGPLFSNYWFGGTIIPGASDGVVSVASTRLPYAEELAVRNWNHGEVRHGSNAFPLFNNKVQISKPMKAVALHDFSERTNQEELDLLVRGGAQDGFAEETFYVENDVKKITINWMSATELDSVELIRPGKKERKTYNVKSVQDTEFFQGAWHHVLEIDNPKKGEWKIRTHTEGKSAYALLVSFDSKLNKQIKFKEDGNKKNWKYVADIGPGNSRGNTPFTLFYDIHFVPEKGNANKKIGHRMRDYKQSKRNNENNQIVIPYSEEGSYNMTVDIEGVTPTGDKFQRTVIKSVYIDDKGNAY